MKYFILNIFIFLFSVIILNSQPWNNSPDKRPTDNFYKIQRNFNDYWRAYDSIPRSKGYKQFKRWEWFWEQRVYPTGHFNDINYQYIKPPGKQNNEKQLAGNWTIIGPSSSVGGYAGLGRVNVSRSPSNENIIFAGAASGGLWKTTNNGQTWSTSTDNFASLGISDILIQASNANIMYLATGDKDASSTYSTGVLKSTNGGTTWNTTGLSFQTSQLQLIFKLVMHPTNANIIYAVGTHGVDKTTNGGTSWTNVLSGTFFDIKLKPGDPTTIYVASTQFFVSTNSGSTWEQMTTGFPSSNVRRVAIDVTPAAPDNVYAIMSNSEYGFGGFYLSTNSGYTWQNRSNTPNILGWSSTGSDAGGQGWYDLCLAVSPIDANLLYIGGINIWRSENAGNTWAIESMWYPVNNTALIHADQHDLWFVNGSSTLYSSNDGGIYRKRYNNSWEWLGSGLQITQFYRLGCSSSDSSLIIAGSQDNGTKLKSSTGFKDVAGGDGMECLIDYQNNNIMYSTLPFGAISRSENGGNNFSNIKPSTARGNWVTPYIINPVNSDILYAAFEDVYKTTNRGNSWFKISNFNLPSNKSLDFISISESDTNFIYAGQGNGIFMRTINGGQSWQTVNRPVDLWITSVAIHPNDPNRILISFSGYTADQRVYLSTDGGSSWQNLSGSLPAVPVNQVIFQKNSPQRIYAATDIGVYFRDNNLTNWVDYSDGLPNVVVNEIEIQYETNMLRAATYGRGLWETQLVQTSLNPDFTGDTNACTSSTVRYIANSFNGVSNSWFVNGGTISGPTNSDTVDIIWNTGTSGSLKLVQELSGSKDSITKTIHLFSPPAFTITGSDVACFNFQTAYTSTATNVSKKWFVTGGNIIGSDTSSTVNVIWTNTNGSKIKLLTKYYNFDCSDSTEKNITVQQISPVAINGPQTVCPNTSIIYFSDKKVDFTKLWKISGGNIRTSYIDSVDVEWDTTQTGKLVLEITSMSTGCKDSIVFNVSKNILPDAVLTGNIGPCLNSTENYSSKPGNFTYKWSTIDGQIIGIDTLNSVSILWKNPGPVNFELIKTDKSTGCIVDTNYSVTVLELPNAIISGSDTVCEKSQATYSISRISGYSIQWSANVGFIIGSKTDSSVTVKWNSSGLGIVKALLKDNQNSCSDSIQFNVSIQKLPDADFSGLLNVCQGCTEKYFAKTSGLKNHWQVIGGNIIGSSEIDSVEVLWNNSPSEIRLIQENPITFCIDSLTRIVNISTNTKPSISGDSFVCEGTQTGYSTSSSNKFSNKWTVNKGLIIGPDNGSSVVIEWTQSGMGEIKLVQINNDNQTLDSAYLNIIIKSKPPKPVIARTNDKLVTSSDSSNKWYLNKNEIAGAFEKEYSPIEEGVYNTKSIYNGCLSDMSEDYYFSFSGVVSSDNCIIQILPNPAKTEIIISYTQDCGNLGAVEIYNSIGQICQSKIINTSSIQVRVQVECSAGLYFGKFRFGNIVKTIPFIITD